MLHPKLCCCVLGQDTWPTLPLMNVIRGVVWCRPAVMIPSVCPQGSCGYTPAVWALWVHYKYKYNINPLLFNLLLFPSVLIQFWFLWCLIISFPCPQALHSLAHLKKIYICKPLSAPWFSIELVSSTLPFLISFTSLSWPFDSDMIRLQLLLRHQVRGAAHEVMTSKWLGEGNDITDAWCPDHNGDQTVQTCKKMK